MVCQVITPCKPGSAIMAESFKSWPFVPSPSLKEPAHHLPLLIVKLCVQIAELFWKCYHLSEDLGNHFKSSFSSIKKALKIIFTNRIQKSGFRMKCNVKWQKNWASTFNILLRYTITENFHVVKFNSSVLLF